jgi:hypothetical protein
VNFFGVFRHAYDSCGYGGTGCAKSKMFNFEFLVFSLDFSNAMPGRLSKSGGTNLRFGHKNPGERSGCTELTDKQHFYKTQIKAKVPPITNLLLKSGQRGGNARNAVTKTVTPRKCTIPCDAACRRNVGSLRQLGLSVQERAVS